MSKFTHVRDLTQPLLFKVFEVSVHDPRVLDCYINSFQLLDVDPQEQAEEDGANVDLDSQRKGKCAVIKTSTRQVCKSEFTSATTTSALNGKR